MQRRKGHNFERETANIFKRFFPQAKRHLEYQSQEALEGVDVKAGPFMIQCKRGRSYAPVTKLYEVQASGIPLLVTKADRKEAIVALKLGDFIELLEKIELEKLC